ncbi:MAG: radical SAM protein [Myxococcota bacterium]|nr:radical SAM protein [Myxococcota bacterium]
MSPSSFDPTGDRPDVPAFLDHRRTFEDLTYVYPVVSRRAGGVSIGVNLNPDKACNFNCVYCQVDRSVPAPVQRVDLEVLAQELQEVLSAVRSGRIWEIPRFAATPLPLRRLNDFAFSGDGEPTTYKRFHEAVSLAAQLRSEHGLDDVKLVLITDAACLHQPQAIRGLEIMDRSNGEVWGKLDAGTEPFYRQVNRTAVPFERVLRNLEACAAARPIVIQSLFFRQHGASPPEDEIQSWLERLSAIEAAGAIREVHVYTIARTPTEPWCAPLPDAEVDRIVQRTREALTCPVKGFYGPP